MSAPEAFYLKLLWPGYIDSDEKYVAIVIAGILATRCDGDGFLTLPPYSMHLTEVGMHLKVTSRVMIALPSLWGVEISHWRQWMHLWLGHCLH